MLINFSVENFRSFNEEQTLNLIANKSQKGHEDHFVPIANTGQHTLPLAIIYGANAAGKSNLVKAIDFARDMILLGAGTLKRLALNQFKLSRKKDKSSSFEFRFMVREQIFIYGFDVTPEKVVSEWLISVSDSGKEFDIFSRFEQEINFGNVTKIANDNGTSEEVLRALKLLGARPNQLLLNIIVNLDDKKRGELLDNVVWWFKECLVVIEPKSHFTPMLEYLDNQGNFREFSSEFLSNVGTGISELNVDQTEINADELPKELLDLLQSIDELEMASHGSGVELSLNPDDPTKVVRRNLSAKHNIAGSDFSLPFNEESDGTQRLLHLLPAMYHLRNENSKVYVIDEIDRSLHPLLSYAMLKFFVEMCPGGCQQLIVTTHESYLLDQKILRRDEIWFAEKDNQQQTHLNSLSDMNIRNDLHIEKGYLQGRFGGIPFIGGMENLSELIDCGSE